MIKKIWKLEPLVLSLSAGCLTAMTISHFPFRRSIFFQSKIIIHPTISIFRRGLLLFECFLLLCCVFSLSRVIAVDSFWHFIDFFYVVWISSLTHNQTSFNRLYIHKFVDLRSVDSLYFIQMYDWSRSTHCSISHSPNWAQSNSASVACLPFRNIIITHIIAQLVCSLFPSLSLARSLSHQLRIEHARIAHQ